MSLIPLRYCGQNIKHINGVLTIGNNNHISKMVTTICGRSYSKDKGSGSSCCKDIAQTAGREVETWPKDNQPPPVGEIIPPNSDPYRIKVHDMVVPPLPPSNAKEPLGEVTESQLRSPVMSLDKTCSSESLKDLFHNSPIVHPDYWKDRQRSKPKQPAVKEAMPKLGYHGRNKYKFAFHEPWRPLDRIALLQQAEKEEFDDTSLHDVVSKP